MADKTVGMLETVPSLHDESLIPVEQSGELMNATGKQFREFAEAAAEQYVDDATNAAERAEAARDSVEGDAAKAQQAATNAANSQQKAAQSEAAAKLAADQCEASVSGVASFNGRGGHVMPQAGDYTAQMVGAAPAGFGWSTNSVRLTSADDLAKLPMKNARYYWTDTAPANAARFANNAGEWGFVETIPEGNFLHLIARSVTDGNYNNVQVSNVYGGVVSPWEWVNPPMQLGVEYRTTERYMGKPVYAKLINFGTLPNATTAIVYIGIPASKIISCVGTVKDGNNIEHFPLISGGAIVGTTWANDAENLFIKTTVDKTSSSAYFVVKYVKD